MLQALELKLERATGDLQRRNWAWQCVASPPAIGAVSWHPFFWGLRGRSPTKLDKSEKKESWCQLILTSLLENLVQVR